MPIIAINAADIQQVISILQTGTYNRFSYSHIHQMSPEGLAETIGDKNIFAAPTMNDPSISFSTYSTLSIPSKEPVTDKNGWKFQVSIEDSVIQQHSPRKQNLARGYNRVKEVLLSHGIGSFKVVNDQTHPDTERCSYERGKQITIHTRFSPHITDWILILREIMIALLLPPPIHPSVMPSNCRQIPGNPFISYRNDFNRNDSSTPITDQQSLKYANPYNPFSFLDPFVDIQFDITEEARSLLSQQNLQHIDSLLEQSPQPVQAASSSSSTIIDVFQIGEDKNETSCCPSCCGIM